MPPIAEVFCKNGLNHKDGKRRFGKFPESLCPECLAKREEPNRVSPREVPFSPTKADFELSDRIQSLAAKINADFDSTIDNCWKRNRQYLLLIDDLGGFRVVLDKDGNQLHRNEREFIEAEFPSHSYDNVRKQRCVGRIEKTVGVPIGTYNFTEIEQLRQFEIRTPNGKSAGSKVNEKAVDQLKACWELACNISLSDRPDKKAIAKAVEKLGHEKRILRDDQKAIKAQKQRERLEAKKETLEKLQQENEQLRHELEVAYENNQSLQEQLAQKEREIQELRCQKTLVAC